MEDPSAQFQTMKLPNGLTVHALHWPGRKLQSVVFRVNSGSKDDPLGCEGVAHFLEHLVSVNGNFERQVLEDYVLNRGGSVNFGRTTESHMRYIFDIPAEPKEMAYMLEKFGFMLLHASIASKIERERVIILEEFNRDYPLQYQHDVMLSKNKALYGGQWLERAFTPLGTPVTIRSIAQPDLQEYYDRHYVPANMEIVTVGGMETDAVVALLGQSPFAASKRGIRNPAPAPETVSPLPVNAGYRLKISEHAKTNADFAGSYGTFSRIPGTIPVPALGIFRRRLAATLFEEVREKRGWTYAIGCDWEKLAAFREFRIRCDAHVAAAAGKIDSVIEECLQKVLGEPDLFRKAQQRRLASLRVSDKTPESVLIGALGDLEHNGRIASDEQDSAVIAALTMDDMLSIGQWLTSERRWVFIGEP